MQDRSGSSTGRKRNRYGKKTHGKPYIGPVGGKYEGTGVHEQGIVQGPHRKFFRSGKPGKPGVPDTPAITPIVSDFQVTDGKFRGERLANSKLAYIEPLSRELREAVFRELGRRVWSSRFLDLCAGTGIMGIEAISRGAMLATFVERKARRCSLIKNSLKSLGIKAGHGEVIQTELAAFLKSVGKRRRFWDVVFYDPPFDADYEEAFRLFQMGNSIKPRGVLVIRHHSEMFFDERIGVLKRRKVVVIADDALSFYDRLS